MSGMSVAAPRRSRGAAALIGVLLGVLGVLVIPASPASAHAALVRTSPAQNAIVATAPAAVVLTFSESVRPVAGKVTVIGPDGKRADTGTPNAAGKTVTIPLRSGGARGTYLVSFRVISADGHPVGGGYSYSVGAPSATPPTATASGGVDPVVNVLIHVARYLGYAGLVLVVGPALVLMLLWPDRLSRRDPRRLVWVGLGLIAIGTITGLLLQAPYTTGGSLTQITGSDLRDVLRSQFGTVSVFRLGVVAAAAVLLRPVLAGRGGPTDRALLAILGVAGVATWPLSGHPAASPVPPVSIVADAVHVASMAVWLGGLVMLVGFLLRRADDRELRAILPVWARWAALAVCALLLAGTVQALIEIGTPKALFSTAYGQLVLAKLGLFSMVIAVAAYSRRMVRTRLAAARPGHLRRAIWAELGITAVVLALSTVLVQTTPARTAVANQEGATPPSYYSATLTSSLYSLQVDLDPAAVGDNSVHLFAYAPDGKPQPVAEWKASASLPGNGIEAIDVPLLKITDNHAIGEIRLPTAGDWRFRFTLRTTDIDQASVTTTVAVK
jgi:copper transport protein